MIPLSYKKKSLLFAVLFLTALLCACAPEKETEKTPEQGIIETAAPAPENTAVPEQTSFTLLCRTEEGAPVPGTRIEVCTGSFCRSLTADEKGTVIYYGMPGQSCDVTPAEAPEGYVFVSDRALIADRPGMEFEFILKEK